MEEENKGITLKGICKTIWLKKWLALIVGVVVVLACAISINYLYNPGVKTCTVEFNLNLPGSDTNAFYSYPDGTLFHYADLTSTETLEDIKSSGKFDNVDVKKMVSKRDISVIRTITTTVLSETNTLSEVSYKVSVKLSYFNDTDQAKDFLIRVASYPKAHLENMEINYDLPDDSDNNRLKEQLNFLAQEYDELMETYSKTFVVNGKTLFSYAQEVIAYLGVENLGSKNNTSDTPTEERTYSIDEVKKFTETFKSTSKAVYAKASSVAFTQPGIIVVGGGMSLKKIALLSVLLGVVIALVAAYVAGYLSLKKAKAKAETVSDVAPEEQPAAQEDASEE